MSRRVRYLPRSRRRPEAYMAAVRWFRSLPESRRLEIVRRVGRDMPSIVAYRLRGGS